MKLISSVLILIFLLSIPFFIWLFQEETALDVAVIDKTVPEENYREHQSIHWLLNHYKYTADGAYDYTTDYYGFMPDEASETYEISELPSDYAEKDLIYIADTYGVYEEDLSWTEEEQSVGNSSLIYGGWEAEEWNAVDQAVRGTQTDLVMEFNSFASPTSPVIRSSILDLLDLKWDGWTGRFFEDLSAENDEVAPWMIERYEAGNEVWDYSGPGFAFVHEFDEEIAVLPSSETYFQEEGISLTFSERGEEMFSLEDSPAFPYWFDIVTPRAEDQVLASYDWNLTEEGTSLLASHNIPASFPAVLHKEETDSDVYYFAGDFVDMEDTPAFYQYAGFGALQSFFRPEFLFPESSFFWKTVRPMLDTIFTGAAKDQPSSSVSAREQAEAGEISYPSRINEEAFEVYEDGEWKAMTIKGVNMGMAKPGYAPGEAAISRDEYRRWFEMIGDMNANTIRNYTLHPPAFYEELLAYNEEAEEPIYLMHGVWIDEEPLEETLDAFTPEIVETFEQEMHTIVDVIHGNAQIDPVPGHASGKYHADISPYVTGWIIGIEWYPVMVDNMLQEYPDLGDYDGEFIYTEDAAPMEYWLAERFDALFAYEKTEYSSMRPLSFTNWVTTDNLDQPAEPSEEEDLAEVNPNHIHTKQEADIVGSFASYHVYPYYPDFLNLEEKYLAYEDHAGNLNSYAGYLNELKSAHEMPILIAEFGIPASRGKTHRNVYGWDQGFISETEQGEIVSYLYETILAEELLGGLVFTWQDEWFKRTWNTMDYDNPYRRPYWSNAQTNEQQFGLLSFDRHKVRINGENDWEEGEMLAEQSGSPLRSLEADHDERYLYLKIEGDTAPEEEIVLYFSVRPDQGIETGEMLADFRLTLDESEGVLEIAGDYDSFYFDYPEALEESQRPVEELQEVFHPIRLALNKELVRPDTGEAIPFEYTETGIFREGIADPDHEEYDSLNDYVLDRDNDIMEVRIPWMLLNAKDPSQKEFIGDLWEDGLEDSLLIDDIAISAALISEGETVDTLVPEEGYTWEDWDMPEYEERLKSSYEILQETFSD